LAELRSLSAILRGIGTMPANRLVVQRVRASVFVRCVGNLRELEPFRGAWDDLAGGSVFRSWTWLSTWWRHYGESDPRRELRAALVFREQSAQPEALLAVLPCYVESSWTQGRVLRLVGDGEVCSDHGGLLALPGEAGAAAQAIAAELAQRDDWDLL
jgi:hypothetical protein